MKYAMLAAVFVMLIAPVRFVGFPDLEPRTSPQMSEHAPWCVAAYLWGRCTCSGFNPTTRDSSLTKSNWNPVPIQTSFPHLPWGGYHGWEK